MAANAHLIAYILGELPESAAAELSRAAEADPELKASIERARTMLNDVRALGTEHRLYAVNMTQREALVRIVAAEAQSPLSADALGRLVMTLVRDSFMRPALSGFRGESGARHLMFSSREGELDVRVVPHAQTGSWRVCGQLAGIVGAHSARIVGSQGAERIDSTGYFEIMTGGSDAVRLEIITAAGVLEVPEFSIGAGGSPP